MRTKQEEYSPEDKKSLEKDAGNKKIGGVWAIMLLVLTTVLMPGLMVVFGVF